MLAALLIASLAVCVLLMLVGWAYDQVGRPAEDGASCPLFSAHDRRPRTRPASWVAASADR